MKPKTKLALLGATVTCAVAPAAALGSASSTVSVRIEGPAKTLVNDKSVKLHAGSVTKGGTPTGVCPALSAAGALGAATHGQWTGKYFASVPGIFITTILGIKAPTSTQFWTVFVDNRSSASGICQVKPHRGEQIMFALTDGSQFPLVLKAPVQARISSHITVNVGYYFTDLKSGHTTFRHPKGIHVTAKGVDAVTDSRGNARVNIVKAGALVLRADGKGFVRAAPLRVSELP